ncbi:uncharacterized protein I303_103977 [Kwoniella dejecticola CBS 10117]|uniref:Uncharacterized protein n=1 Tax=Kwoniella dejecticola CBS 10117 TaxID=1296121 RepID=A0A1A6A890_9TREE|nr:uncharacterized protein I303_03994 [Kwoniella dejecticola CBS 10117]OBR86272.1 hypothetical protein I303_03994 [Kwoniella dejecticola CBS 10117]
MRQSILGPGHTHTISGNGTCSIFVKRDCDRSWSIIREDHLLVPLGQYFTYDDHKDGDSSHILSLSISGSERKLSPAIGSRMIYKVDSNLTLTRGYTAELKSANANAGADTDADADTNDWENYLDLTLRGYAGDIWQTRNWWARTQRELSSANGRTNLNVNVNVNVNVNRQEVSFGQLSPMSDVEDSTNPIARDFAYPATIITQSTIAPASAYSQDLHAGERAAISRDTSDEVAQPSRGEGPIDKNTGSGDR